MNESFTRWQGRSIEQLGGVINLLLGLSIAIMGYLINFVSAPNTTLECWDKFFFILSLIFSFSSIAFGITTNLNRLCDFRITTKIARRREKNVSSIELQDDRKTSKRLGKRTWCLFYILITTFSLSIIMTTILFLRIYSNKIF
jgi:hypothetical protein